MTQVLSDTHLLACIFSHLKPFELDRGPSVVSRRFYAAARDQTLWKQYCERQFDDADRRADGEDWRQFYFGIHRTFHVSTVGGEQLSLSAGTVISNVLSLPEVKRTYDNNNHSRWDESWWAFTLVMDVCIHECAINVTRAHDNDPVTIVWGYGSQHVFRKLFGNDIIAKPRFYSVEKIILNFTPL
jgi:hypothetical protein